MKTSRKLAMIAAMTATAALAITGCTQRNSEDPSGNGAEEGGGGGGDISVAFVPKLQGIPYFEAMNTGGEQAAEELGFEWLYQGPTDADAAAQAEIVRSFIQQDVDVLFVAPNDPNSMAPVLQEAQDAGIAVATTDTDAPDSGAEISEGTTSGSTRASGDGSASAGAESGQEGRRSDRGGGRSADSPTPRYDPSGRDKPDNGAVI